MRQRKEAKESKNTEGCRSRVHAKTLQRIDEIESMVVSDKQKGIGFLLDVVRQYGYKPVNHLFCTEKGLESLRRRIYPEDLPDSPKPFAKVLHLFAGDENVIAKIEQFRGLVPDEVLRQAYNFRRNYAYPGHNMEIRRLAGVVDEHGNVMPGYVMTDSGSIVDAEVSS